MARKVIAPQEFKPNAEYFQGIANQIVRMSKVDPEQIASIDINCGSSSRLGWVILKNGERIKV